MARCWKGHVDFEGPECPQCAQIRIIREANADAVEAAREAAEQQRLNDERLLEVQEELAAAQAAANEAAAEARQRAAEAQERTAEAQERMEQLARQRLEEERRRIQLDQHLAELRSGLPEFSPTFQAWWRSISVLHDEHKREVSTADALQKKVTQADERDDRAQRAVIDTFAKRFDGLLTAADPSVDLLPSPWFKEASAAQHGSDQVREASPALLVRDIDHRIWGVNSSGWPEFTGWRLFTSATIAFVAMILVGGFARGCGVSILGGAIAFAMAAAFLFNHLNSARAALFQQLRESYEFAIRLRPLAEQIETSSLDDAPPLPSGGDRLELENCRRATLLALTQVRRPLDSKLFWEWMHTHFADDRLMQAKEIASRESLLAEDERDEHLARMTPASVRERVEKIYEVAKGWIAAVGREIQTGIRVPGSTREHPRCPQCDTPVGISEQPCSFCGVVLAVTSPHSSERS